MTGTPDPGGAVSGSVRLVVPSPSPEEAAAIVAALEQFMRATAPRAPSGARLQGDPWRQAALLEGVEREPEPDLGHLWLNT